VIALGTLLVALVVVTSDARAATYRCEFDGRVTYGDAPCARGSQSELVADPAPDAASRKAAAARAKAERAALDTVEQDREQTERRAAARLARDQVALSRQRVACAKAAVRSKRANEDAAAANGRDTTKAKTRAKRAAEDEATQCHGVRPR